MEKIRIDERSLNKFCGLLDLYSHFPILEETQGFKRIHCTQVFQIAAGRAPDRPSLVSKSGIHGDDAIHVWITQRFQHYTVEHAEHRGSCANSEPKRDDCNGGKA